jgi:hypothetical protein
LQHQAVLQDVAIPGSTSYPGVGASGGSLLPLSRGPTQVGTTAGVAFRAAVMADGEMDLGVTL